ncbi:hypothetical protein VTK73DRAFT_217 [Phialemonium thermophilum]|uniref:N-acetyltransferase domain-containing protein n=1 Tax=Phialemonium thermophilum TaxID=223376 RepID=A0ABR3VWC5_9PEZI
MLRSLKRRVGAAKQSGCWLSWAGRYDPCRILRQRNILSVVCFEDALVLYGCPSEVHSLDIVCRYPGQCTIISSEKPTYHTMRHDPIVRGECTALSCQPGVVPPSLAEHPRLTGLRHSDPPRSGHTERIKAMPTGHSSSADGADARVRRAAAADVDWVVALSARVQDHLTASGSQQIIGPLGQDQVEQATAAGHCYVLEERTTAGGEATARPVGSVFVAPLPLSTYTYPAQLGADASYPRPFWLLESLMLEPSRRGRGLGRCLVDGVLHLLREEWAGRGGGGTVFLDCWEGNARLREFYTGAGFRLLGFAPELDYTVAVFARTV